ncbi:MAG: hypothetical protein H0X03_01490 [Nitrosopumilus sp.]|nr:hypothetical protein [Nitrosopumilus sp.]
MTKKNNTNKTKEKKITISDILDENNDKTEIYKDIFQFIILKGKENSKNEIDPQQYFSNSGFRVWDLSKWLLKNNRELSEKFQGSHQSTYSKTHSKIQNVTTLLSNLEELNLIVKGEKVPSLRNYKIETEIYNLSLDGILIASLIDFKKLQKGTSKYRSALESLFKLWVKYIPQGSKDHNNSNYHFLIRFLKNCVEKYDDILLDFLKFLRECKSDLVFNFSELRYKINNTIFKRLIVNKEFRNLYYNVLKDYEADEMYLKNLQQLIKHQFKLDIETQIERYSSRFLNFPSYDMKRYQWSNKPRNQHLSYEEVIENNYDNDVYKERVFDYNIKNQWEKKRNENLINFNKITLIVKCDKCNQIYPYSFETEKEIIDKIICINCNQSKLKFYDFDNESNSLYLQEMFPR